MPEYKVMPADTLRAERMSALGEKKTIVIMLFAFHFFKDLFFNCYIRIWTCACECRYLQRPEEDTRATGTVIQVVVSSVAGGL